MITLVLKPHIERDGSRTDRFDAYLDDVLILTSRQPLLDGARKLLEMGYSPDQLLTARHHDRTYPSFVCRPIGELAKWTIKEGDRRGLEMTEWKPYNGPISEPVQSPDDDNASPGI